MPYITTMMSPAIKQVTFDDIMASDDLTKQLSWNHPNTAATKTYFINEFKEQFLRHYDFDLMYAKLYNFYYSHKELYEANRRDLYSSFHIAKKSGGLRKIDAPNDELKNALRELSSLLRDDCGARYHTSAFAYVKSRSHVDALKKHQYNESRWFLKIDFSNFFGSTTFEFVMRMLSQIFPFSEMMKTQSRKSMLEKTMELCFLDGVLPQGTPISPMLTNLIMIPLDAEITKRLRSQYYIYTRYADDILVSNKYKFDHAAVLAEIENVIKKFDAPYVIKAEKTRFGSSAGKNFNFGLMLNKDNEITIGHRKKKQLKAMLHNFVMDYKSGVVWDLYDVQVMQGNLSYYKSVEPKNIKEIIAGINAKMGVDVEKLMKSCLK